ncbi:hypothetical protein P5Y53_06230 [Dyella jiangningensis]|uniref:hypothetical protein n=1 Tax=Dyella jiangningensis TaxID=1379159 RepID=UPI000AC88445|nr:hypothetical protein [Dyella jiangningensis]MDG2537253.1 hypothetical protein [Dyella jiangningensis]
MMKRWSGLLGGVLVLVAPSAWAELRVPDVRYPSLPAQAVNAEGFVPNGWRLESQAADDLNGDGRPDLVLVLRQQDPANVIRNDDGLGENPLDTNPRMLAVAFARDGGGYALALQNHSLIPRHDIPTIEDMLEEGGVSVQRGALRVTLHFWANAGSWSMGNTTYTFRWQNGRFELIGYDSDSVMRNSGASESLSINYSTGKVKRTTGNMQDDKEAVTWQKLSSSRRWSLDEVGDGSAFDPLPAR